MTENAFTKDPLTIDDVVALSLHACNYNTVSRAIDTGELPAEKVDGRYLVTRAVADLWIASRRSRTTSRGDSETALTIEEVVGLSTGKETYNGVRRAIERGDLAATQVPGEMSTAVRAAMSAGTLPEAVSVGKRFMIERADAVAWLARTAPAGITVDAVVALGAGRVNAAIIYKAIDTGALPAERFGEFYRVAQSDATTWLAQLPTVNV